MPYDHKCMLMPSENERDAWMWLGMVQRLAFRSCHGSFPCTGILTDFPGEEAIAAPLHY